MKHVLFLFTLYIYLLMTVVVFAQDGRYTTVTIDQLLLQTEVTIDAFRVVGKLAGVTAASNMLVNLTKYGLVGDFIDRKDIKWVRPILALISGFLGGLLAALVKGLPWPVSCLYALGGLLSGGGAIALHEIVSLLRGER